MNSIVLSLPEIPHATHKHLIWEGEKTSWRIKVLVKNYIFLPPGPNDGIMSQKTPQTVPLTLAGCSI